MRRRGRPKFSARSRTAQIRDAQKGFRSRMKTAGLCSIQAYLPSALVEKIDQRKAAHESRGDYLARVLAPIHGLKPTKVTRRFQP